MYSSAINICLTLTLTLTLALTLALTLTLALALALALDLIRIRTLALTLILTFILLCQVLLYNFPELHLLVLQLILSLLLNPFQTAIEKIYFSEQPLESNKLNVPYVISKHLNHKANSAIIPPLLDAAYAMGRGVVRLMKLTVHGLFQHQTYFHRRRMVSGAFGTVYSCRPPQVRV